MKRVLLVRSYMDAGGGGAVPPLGLLYVAAALRRGFPGGCEIRLLDTAFARDPEGAVEEAVRGFRPDLAGFSVLNCEAALAHRLAAAAKRALPSVFTVFGGPYATVSPEAALKDPCVDACVMGEGEVTVTELLLARAGGRAVAGLPGVAARAGGKVLIGPPRGYIEDLDSLGFPAWDLVDLERYSRQANWNGYIRKKIYAPILTSRGCAFRCVYCHNLFGKRLRFRSVAGVAAEIGLLREGRGVEEFHVVDDVFNFDKARVLEFSKAVSGRFPGLAFSFPNGLRADLIDGETMRALREMGTYKVHYGVESASERVRRSIGKELSLEKVAGAVRLADREGIVTGGYFMMGFPGETREEMRETADYAAASGFDAAYFFRAIPYPGTALYESLPEAERPAEGSGFFPIGRPGSARDAEISSEMLRAQLNFYLSWRRAWRLLRKSYNLAGFASALPGFAARVLIAVLLLALSRPSGAPRTRT